MYLFLSDETNTTQSDTVQFLIFGAMVIPMENAPAAVKEVLEIRQCHGYPPGSEFKFDTRNKPNNPATTSAPNRSTLLPQLEHQLRQLMVNHFSSEVAIKILRKFRT